jgi:putative ABC transport system permease protein
MMIVGRIRDNVAVALDTLRVNKLRSGLTILGVVIGVSTVMAMSAIVQGVRQQIIHTIEIAGPSTFYVLKIYSQTLVNPDRLPKYIRVRPDLTMAEATRIAQLPEIAYASIWGQTTGRVEYKGEHTQPIVIMGADDRYTEIQGGELLSGRWFTRSELSSGAGVAVLDESTADKVFGRESPLDKQVRVGGWPMTVIGIYDPPGNIFSPPGQTIGAIVPYLTLSRQFHIDKTNALYIPVKPRADVSVTAAREAVTIALREMRKLRPGDRNSFDLVTQDQILDTFNKFTGVFFLIMIVLSSVALLVGGIGVMAIMMVSVTDRTKEIGIRKAVGATNREILLQFLVEAATLTGIGGTIGIGVGTAVGWVISSALHIEAATPITLTLIAVAVSISIGIIFGLLPARRAARLDPIEALRYE